MNLDFIIDSGENVVTRGLSPLTVSVLNLKNQKFRRAVTKINPH
jgi:hypothetical protein